MTDELKAWSEERAYERAKAECVEKLDKIRAEIRTMEGYIETIADVLAIIDKYKAESEGRR